MLSAATARAARTRTQLPLVATAAGAGGAVRSQRSAASTSVAFSLDRRRRTPRQGQQHPTWPRPRSPSLLSVRSRCYSTRAETELWHLNALRLVDSSKELSTPQELKAHIDNLITVLVQLGQLSSSSSTPASSSEASSQLDVTRTLLFNNGLDCMRTLLQHPHGISLYQMANLLSAAAHSIHDAEALLASTMSFLTVAQQIMDTAAAASFSEHGAATIKARFLARVVPTIINAFGNAGQPELGERVLLANLVSGQAPHQGDEVLSLSTVMRAISRARPSKSNPMPNSSHDLLAYRALQIADERRIDRLKETVGAPLPDLASFPLGPWAAHPQVWAALIHARLACDDEVGAEVWFHLYRAFMHYAQGDLATPVERAVLPSASPQPYLLRIQTRAPRQRQARRQDKIRRLRDQHYWQEMDSFVKNAVAQEPDLVAPRRTVVVRRVLEYMRIDCVQPDAIMSNLLVAFEAGTQRFGSAAELVEQELRLVLGSSVGSDRDNDSGLPESAKTQGTPTGLDTLHAVGPGFLAALTEVHVRRSKLLAEDRLRLKESDDEEDDDGQPGQGENELAFDPELFKPFFRDGLFPLAAHLCGRTAGDALALWLELYDQPSLMPTSETDRKATNETTEEEDEAEREAETQAAFADLADQNAAEAEAAQAEEGREGEAEEGREGEAEEGREGEAEEGREGEAEEGREGEAESDDLENEMEEPEALVPGHEQPTLPASESVFSIEEPEPSRASLSDDTQASTTTDHAALAASRRYKLSLPKRPPRRTAAWLCQYANSLLSAPAYELPHAVLLVDSLRAPNSPLRASSGGGNDTESVSSFVDALGIELESDVLSGLMRIGHEHVMRHYSDVDTGSDAKAAQSADEKEPVGSRLTMSEESTENEDVTTFTLEPKGRAAANTNPSTSSADPSDDKSSERTTPASKGPVDRLSRIRTMLASALLAELKYSAGAYLDMVAQAVPGRQLDARTVTDGPTFVAFLRDVGAALADAAVTSEEEDAGEVTPERRAALIRDGVERLEIGLARAPWARSLVLDPTPEVGGRVRALASKLLMSEGPLENVFSSDRAEREALVEEGAELPPFDEATRAELLEIVLERTRREVQARREVLRQAWPADVLQRSAALSSSGSTK